MTWKPEWWSSLPQNRITKKEWKEMKRPPGQHWTHKHSHYRGPRRRREREPEKIFEEIIVENFPNIGKEIATQVQEVERVPGRINPRRNTLRHIVIKLTKIKDKEKLLKATREKWQITYKGTPIRLTAAFSAEFYKAEGSGTIYLKWWKGRTYNQDYSTWQGSRSNSMENSKALQTSKS